MRIDDFYNYLKAFHGITLYATRHLNDMKLLKSHSILTRFHTFLYTFVKYIMEPTPSLCFTGLHTHGYDDCQPFSLKGKTLQARLVNVHDGDTHTYIIELYPGDFYRFTVRVAGIDTPELKSINPILAGKAAMARSRVADLLSGRSTSELIDSAKIRVMLDKVPCIVTLVCYGNDKFNRQLADVWSLDRTVNVATELIKEKLAYAYQGGRKFTEDDQLCELTN